jgi:LsmAD domain
LLDPIAAKMRNTKKVTGILTASTGFMFLRSGKPSGAKNPPVNAWSKPLAVPKKTSSSTTTAAAAATTPPALPPGLSAIPTGTTPQGPTNHRTPKGYELGDLRGRFVSLLLTLTDQKVTVTMLSGETISGVLHTVTPFAKIAADHRNKYVLKGVEGTGNVILDMSKVAHLHVPSCRLETTNQAFTDAEIAAKSVILPGNGELVQADASWTSAPATTPAVGLTGNIAGWDQFKVNEALFNVKGDFDESIYTTTLDRSQLSTKDKQKAEQLAREIESSTTQNIHQAEERNQAFSQDYDEEDRYSGVLKQGLAPKLNYAQAAAKKDKEKAATKEAIPPKKDFFTTINGDKRTDTKQDDGLPADKPIQAKKEENETDDAELEKITSAVAIPNDADEHFKDISVRPAAPEPSKSKLNVNASEFKPPTLVQPLHPMVPYPTHLQQHQLYPPQGFAIDPATGMQFMIPPMPMQHGEYPGAFIPCFAVN